MSTGLTGALLSVQELLNAQSDIVVNQPTRFALSASPMGSAGAVSGTSILKTAAGIFNGVVIGNPTLTSAIAVWDSATSGSNQVFKLAAGVSGGFWGPLNVKLQNGLTVSAGSVLDNITWIWL